MRQHHVIIDRDKCVGCARCARCASVCAWASYDKMFAALFVICFIFTVVTKTLNLIKKRVLRWQIGVVK